MKFGLSKEQGLRCQALFLVYLHNNPVCSMKQKLFNKHYAPDGRLHGTGSTQWDQWELPWNYYSIGFSFFYHLDFGL